MNGTFITALNALCATHGMSMVTKGDTVTITDTNQAAQQLGRDGRHLGLEAQDYGTIFTNNGKRFKLTGVKLSRPTYPISGEEVGSGRGFKFPTSVVNQIIAARGNKPVTQQTIQAPTATPAPATQPADNAYADFGQF